MSGAGRTAPRVLPQGHADDDLGGIERYGAPGLICGIGPVYATRLVWALGDTVFDLIDTDMDQSAEPAPCGVGMGTCRAFR